MDFTVIEKQDDFVTAVIICFYNGTLPKQFWENLTLAQCLDICLHNVPGQEIKNRAKQHLTQFQSFAEWEKIFLTRPEKPCQNLALEKMMSLATTFGDWLKIYTHGEGNLAVKELAYRKMNAFFSNK